MLRSVTMLSSNIQLLLLCCILPLLIKKGHGVGVPEGYIDPETGLKATWTYADKANWPTSFPLYCAGTSQSPINLDRFLTTYRPYPRLIFANYGNPPTKHTVKNIGHSVQVTFTANKRPFIAGGFLGINKYILEQFHFHWGADVLQGSEHTIATVKYPLELHLVHFHNTYDDVADAVSKGAGSLAVVGVMFEISAADNPKLAPLLAAFPSITTNDAMIDITGLPWSDLLPDNLDEFYAYSGGLTTPTCNEVVNWTVLKNAVPISEAQLAVFRSLQDANGAAIVNNYRVPQPTNGRTVYRNFR